MISRNFGRFGAVVFWRSWLLGFQFGPEVWEVHLGPLFLWFDPQGIHDPQPATEVER